MYSPVSGGRRHSAESVSLDCVSWLCTQASSLGSNCLNPLSHAAAPELGFPMLYFLCRYFQSDVIYFPCFVFFLLFFLFCTVAKTGLALTEIYLPALCQSAGVKVRPPGCVV